MNIFLSISVSFCTCRLERRELGIFAFWSDTNSGQVIQPVWSFHAVFQTCPLSSHSNQVTLAGIWISHAVFVASCTFFLFPLCMPTQDGYSQTYRCLHLRLHTSAYPHTWYRTKLSTNQLKKVSIFLEPNRVDTLTGAHGRVQVHSSLCKFTHTHLYADISACTHIRACPQL